MNKMSNECAKHPGEQMKLFCLDPCRTALCQDCFKTHKGHEIRSLDEVIEELSSYLGDMAKERKEEQITCGNQIETLDNLKTDVETLLKRQIEEEKKMEQVVLEPLKEIINNFQDKVNSFLSSLGTKKESCEVLEDRAYNQTKALEADLNSVNALIKKEDWPAVYEMWINHLHKPLEREDSSDKEALLDVDALRECAEDLRNLNVMRKMKIVVQSFTSALQMENDDQVSRFADKLALSNEDMKALQETLTHARARIKEVNSSMEAMKKEIKNLTTAATNVLKKSEIDKAEETIEKSEKMLKKARERLIEEAQNANSLYSELLAKQKDLNHMLILNINTISDWKKGILNCEKENAAFKKLFSQIKELLEDYGKEIVKYNLQYGQKIEEFEGLDDKLQGIRGQMRKQHVDQLIKKTKYKLRMGVVSIAGAEKSLAQVLMNSFLCNSMGEDMKEPLAVQKGYSVTASFDMYEVEFCLWNLGTPDDVKTLDTSYLDNVEAILLLYGTNSKESVESIKKAVELVNEKASGIVILVGISKENSEEADKEIKEYVLSKRVSLKIVNVTDDDNVKELFFGILYARYPELYESVNS
eukprot:TRINITY_DN10566_c0_g1_i2.p1 TRINITY_DN10566_c0_g1~~TRINITY_DN10566_c0_g1_i2.p1  ORF type:complete len:587 (-),score=209.81 TRINITY_DN10566_c0_g1_i2:58-1818(-)